MRFGLMDLLFAAACIAVGYVAGFSLSSPLPQYLRVVAAALSGLGVYIAFVYPFYRGLKLFPLLLPRCACCSKFQDQLEILCGRWPRVRFRCPTCRGEFVIWLNGKPGNGETWETPVLALKWPYAFGRYQRLRKPEPGIGEQAEHGD